MTRKLILFDIDGTLLKRIDSVPVGGVNTGVLRFLRAVDRVFGIKDAKWKTEKYNGTVDRFILWDLVKHQITRPDFKEKFSQLVDAMYTDLITESENKNCYQALTPAVELALLLKASPDHEIGLLTGNVQSIALWKIDCIGLKDVFDFGLYGDETDSRVKLAKKVFVKARAYFHTDFVPQTVFVIGDTVNDIKCGQAIGANTIGVTTGYHTTKHDLVSAGATLVCDSLMDISVLELLSLKMPQ